MVVLAFALVPFGKAPVAECVQPPLKVKLYNDVFIKFLACFADVPPTIGYKAVNLAVKLFAIKPASNVLSAFKIVVSVSDVAAIHAVVNGR
jgi:hypothetical protein